ncbi:MAG: ATP synthase F1 subunit delta [Dehalococcoidia bacterium]|nr:ATP synthase F1 subunit delta [Dehalococcoidia bacterium]
MIQEVAAKRYAEAAYLIAREDGKEEAWAEGLRAMAALFGDAGARALLQNTRVPVDQKAQLVEAALKGVDPLVLNLARLLLRRGRTALGPQIAEAYQELLDAAKGVSHAAVTTAVPLSPEDLKAVERRLSELTGGPVIVTPAVDESILGGLVVRIGDRLIDGSTKSRLQALKRQLEGARA